MCHMITINPLKSFVFTFICCPNNKQDTSNEDLHKWYILSKKTHFMKVFLTMYNRIKAFINNMDTFHLFKTSQNV